MSRSTNNSQGFAALKRDNDGVGIHEAGNDGGRSPPSAVGSSSSAGGGGVDQESMSDLHQLDERRQQQQPGDAGLSQGSRASASQRNRQQGAASTAELAPPLRPLSSSAADRCHSPFVEEDVAVFECMASLGEEGAHQLSNLSSYHNPIAALEVI